MACLDLHVRSERPPHGCQLCVFVFSQGAMLCTSAQQPAEALRQAINLRVSLSITHIPACTVESSKRMYTHVIIICIPSWPAEGITIHSAAGRFSQARGIYIYVYIYIYIYINTRFFCSCYYYYYYYDYDYNYYDYY